MISAWLSKAATPLIKIGVLFVLGAGLSLGAVCLGYRIADRIGEIIIDRVAAAVELTDAKWKLEIADANMKLALAQAAQANDAMRLNSELAAAREDARLAKEERKKANAALPGGADGGLDVGRVRLLNRQR